MSTHGANTLVSLPRPLGSLEGQYHAATVWGWRNGSRNRKRSEIVVGIDGEGVNIYNVETPRLATSYALPPHVSFTCPPCSISQKQRDHGVVQRLTYASTVNQGRQMVCFLDVVKRKESRAGPPPETSGTIYTHNIEKSQRDIVYVDAIPLQKGATEGNITNDVVLVHADGEVRCLAGNLQEERWRASPRTVLGMTGDDSSKAAFDIEYAAVADVAAGREGLLRGQGHAIAVLDAQVNKDSQNSWRMRLLILISKPLTTDSVSQSEGRALHVLAICPQLGPATSKFNRGTLRSLCRIKLPELEDASAKLGKVLVHASSGILQFISGGVLFTYDLTGTSPKLSSRLQGMQKDIISFLRLPSGHALAATPTSLTTYDLSYESIQATMPIVETRQNTSSSRKRKLSGSTDRQQECIIDLLTYLPSVGLAIGRINERLVGYDLSLGNTGPGHTKRMKTGSLIDALGCGIRSEKSRIDTSSLSKGMRTILGTEVAASTPKQDVRWQRRMEELDQCTQSQDVEGFEKLFAAEVGMRRNEDGLRDWISRKDAWESAHSQGTPRHKVNGEQNGSSNGDFARSKASSIKSEKVKDFPERKPIPEWYWPQQTDSQPETTQLKPIHPEKVTFVLGKIFSCQTANSQPPNNGLLADGNIDGGLSIVFYPPNVLRWLVESGNLTTRNIDQALHRAGTMSNRQALASPESLVTTLLEVSPEARLLPLVFQAPVFLDAEEVVCAMKPLIYRLQRSRGPYFGGHDTDLNTTERERLQETHSLAGQKEGSKQGWHVSNATPTIDTAGSLKKALSLGLIKLNTFAAPRITKAFRSLLTTDELTYVVNLLRGNLVAQGWTSWHLEVEEANMEAGDDNGGIHLITNLLSCALNSFGAAALIYGPSNSNTLTDPDELVTGLRAEISAALVVIEEATYLRGVVGEMLRYGKQAMATTENNRRPKGPANIVVVNPNSTGTKLLPLGLKREADVSREKVEAGGVIGKRTPRDRARLESMKVGKYTIERITV